ncbi:MAG TPA: Calx-beta domain-containing protein, partial [Gemmatimonadales bacterium]|nr:Calx-beta domain-containing protein [Gemmatimonadales bacterium]
MKKTPKRPKRAVPRIARGIAPTAAIASGLLAPPLLAAPGDLDPSFGDMGRVNSVGNFKGTAWAIKPLTGGQSLIGGGESFDFDCSYYHCSSDGFMGRISASGTLDEPYTATLLSGTEVNDFVLQPDGKLVATGQDDSRTSQLIVFRLEADGALDAGFADGGVLRYPRANNAAGQSVVLDPSGAIVVAGSSDGNLFVLRLLANGQPDPSFGSAGVYTGPAISSRVRLLRTGAGGYRISTALSAASQDTTHCSVLALTAAGALDTSYGASGVATPASAAGTSSSCQSMAAQSDGSLLLAGQEGDHGYVGRLLASGVPDASFVADPVVASMSDATAVAFDPAGAVLVAGLPGNGTAGALIVRLQASGMLDGLFGNAGSTWIDLHSSEAMYPAIYDMSVLADGGVLAAGGDWSVSGQRQPLLIRLVGTAGTATPGVIGAEVPILAAKEEDQKAVMTVRRLGGAAGQVSVAYHTADYTGADAATATAGADYTAVSGRLTWADGDFSDRQITVPILADSGQVEEAERFVIALDDVQGGAGLGTEGVVEIAADGAPAGQFGFVDSALTVLANAGTVQVYVYRNYYSQGAVSVTVTPVPGSATSADFSPTPIVLSWADGDSSWQTANIPITNSGAESPRSFTVQLSNPTNGAVVGPSTLEVTINPAAP